MTDPDLPAPFLAEPPRPWPDPLVMPVVEHCPRCLGVLPADVRSACSTCGTGTPAEPQGKPPADTNWLVTTEPPAPAPPSEDEMVEVTAAAPASARLPWMTTLRSWARWPNV